jgi:endonuclease YncB( thermonuclease family)
MAGLIEKWIKKKLNTDKVNNDIPLFNFKGKKKICKVVDIYDGDTCKVVFYHGGKLWRWNVRLYNLDTPEFRVSKNDPEREIKKQKAIEARDYLRDLILNKIVWIHCDDFDKYGRLLGIFYLEKNSEKSVNDLMLENGHGYAYDGGKKMTVSFL